MQHILILGAGLSASSLIQYLLERSETYDWKIRLGDLSLETAQSKINKHLRGEAFYFDVNDEQQCRFEVQKADLVISMLPASLHFKVARASVDFGKNMVTASYVSPQIAALHQEAVEKGVLILNEIGVDPGIDHMSAMKVINRVKTEGGEITAFQSSTGGLIAPKYDDNPWNYKFTWNPRNVVVAGQGVSVFIQNGLYKYIPYHKLFKNLHQTSVLEYGAFEVYPNRDSVKYREIYGLENIPSMFRGTMRRPGFSQAWDIFVQLGLTDDSFTLEDSENMSYRDFVDAFLPFDEQKSVEGKVAALFGIEQEGEMMAKLAWLDLFKPIKIGLKRATPAQILQQILMKKWVLGPDDKDMIVMQHRFEVRFDSKKKTILSSMVLEGSDQTHTAMSKTVGYPLAIAAKLILLGKIKAVGVLIPIAPAIYEPVLEELEELGIRFVEQEFSS